ncbi:MAG TPA: NAD(P)H-dependent oxidoreductase [Pseudonocardiaceae bacterium]|jgi:NAD(P)H-dependent FMN reductase|nr:NAD(P)H-dependent oxidoreductase [Pseudonocardiaceae bacterium]
MPTLTVVVASTRPGRVGPTIADWLVDAARAHDGFDVRVADLAELALPLLDEPEHPSDRDYRHPHTRQWSALVAESDAFVLVMPEYNYGFTAPLKNALDYLYHEWAHKPVGFVSYGMTSAGLRAVEMIKPVVTALRLVPVGSAVCVPLRERLAQGGVLAPSPVMTAAATSMLDELLAMSAALAPLRALSR